MDPAQFASFTSLLAPIFGARAAGIMSIIALTGVLVQLSLIVLPVAHSTSPGWYQVLFGILSRVALNIGKNAPMPPAGTLPAGPMVPVPPALKGTNL